MATEEVYSLPVQKAARWISDLANPLFIPPFTFIFIGLLNDVSGVELWWLVGLSLLFYTAFPLLSALLMLRNGNIESLDLPNRRSRNKLYLLGIASSTIGSLILGIFFYLHRPFLTLVSAVFFINPVIGYLLNRKWKVSIHSASVASGGIILLTYYNWNMGMYQYPALVFSLLMLLILLPVMMWSRYHLKIHSIPELVGGATAGIFFTTLEIMIMFYFWNSL
ncbi:MAG: phosphatase PAP2 family protein [Balneolaceae bacterium]|nr:phosphatase PAP2 family protein [Balneolaceae bacterium]